MNVKIQTVHFNADSKLMEYVNKKLEKLTVFSDRIIQVQVYLKLDNVVHSIKDKIAEIRVHVPRHNFFVKSTSKSFEESFDSAFDSLVSQIKRKTSRVKTSGVDRKIRPFFLMKTGRPKDMNAGHFSGVNDSFPNVFLPDFPTSGLSVFCFR